LCLRRNPYFSKITWELYLYSVGLVDELTEYWNSQEKYILSKLPLEVQTKFISEQEQSRAKMTKRQRKRTPSVHLYPRIDRLEKSVELFDIFSKPQDCSES